ncbi:MAG TPA: FCD domain-containing protein [Pirellulales bacterium]|nr:FCD domain-containing protein [Pirellulales bacterium]
MVIAAAEKSTAAPGSVLDSIWEIVRQRGLKSGDQLPSIRELAERLGVKQTAVRDALLKAEAMGLVNVLPRAGAFLRGSVPAPATNGASLDESLAGALHDALLGGEQNLLHMLDARRLIEIELAGRAADRRRLEDLLPVRRALEAMLQLPADAARAEHVTHDVRFHIEIARLSGNLVLFVVQRTLLELLRPHLNEVPRGLQRRTQTGRSHVAIYEALVAGDAEKARREMREHLSLAYDVLLRDLQQVPALEY